MTKEIYHEGWLIKSPPTKRIWRARWRRRWFTLKQGEIPEQFCLEYYTDRNCRKLKGVIDLDQCEQVDSGLQLEHRKQKFQHMFDVKTPRRTYYLAADSEEDMNAWVNCICEVCNLQDLSKQQQQSNNESRQYYNVGAEAIVNQPTSSSLLAPTLKNVSLPTKSSTNALDQMALLSTVEPVDNNNSVYQNYDAMFRNSAYNNRETIICDAPLTNNSSATNEPKEDYYNFKAIAKEANRQRTFERSTSMRSRLNVQSNGIDADLPLGHARTQSLVERNATTCLPLSRKIPEKLKLSDNVAIDSTPSPALSTSSGPYIAISECISGNPIIDRDNPMTPLNSLDPKFYDTPRSHINIGLNLTNEQPYSPKRNNGPTTQAKPLRSGRSSPTDSESVFTDDEEWIPTNATDTSIGDRNLRPSESSVENDSIVFTYAQRFSKLPHEESASGAKVHSRRAKHIAGLLMKEDDGEDQSKEVNSSDTENASPAIAYGPKDINSCVEESYDIPRSHHLPYCNVNNNKNDNETDDRSPNSIAPQKYDSSTLKLDENRASGKVPMSMSNQQLNSSTLPKARSHFYTNAAPTTVEGNVFRYDFDEKQSDAPAVDRNLKPKLTNDESEMKNATSNKPFRAVPSLSSVTAHCIELKPPVNRSLKPATPIMFETNSLRRRGGPANLSFTASTSDIEFQTDFNSEQFSKTLPRNYNNSMSFTANSSISLAPLSMASTTNAAAGRKIGVLEYFDLDHSNPPPICKSANTSVSTSNLSSQSNASSNQSGQLNVNNPSNRLSGLGASTSSVFGTLKKAQGATNSTNKVISAEAAATAAVSGIVYKSVDFIKTEAFMRTRQDAEAARAKNRSKE